MKIGPNNFYIPDDDNHAGAICEHARRYVTFRHQLKFGGAAVDAGAHVGYWTNLLLPDYDEIWAFEPRQENFDCLHQNVPATVKICQIALGAASGSGTLKLGGREGNSGAYYISEQPGEVVIEKLDSMDIRNRLSLLKLDVEGMEISALMGGEETINRDHPDIIIECNTAASENYGWEDDAPRELLKSWGYAIVGSAGNDFLFKYEGGKSSKWKNFQC